MFALSDFWMTKYLKVMTNKFTLQCKTCHLEGFSPQSFWKFSCEVQANISVDRIRHGQSCVLPICQSAAHRHISTNWLVRCFHSSGLSEKVYFCSVLQATYMLKVTWDWTFLLPGLGSTLSHLFSTMRLTVYFHVASDSLQTNKQIRHYNQCSSCSNVSQNSSVGIH